MNVDTLLVFILITLLMVELFTTAYRTALLNASLARLLALREEMEVRVNRTVRLLQKPQTWEASSKLTFWITRFLGAGLLLALFAPAEWNSGSIALEAGILLGVALLVFWLEWVVDSAVSRNPENWAMRLAPAARMVGILLMPLLALPLLLDRRRIQEPVGTVTEEELKSMVDAGHEGGVLEQDERQMIFSIFELGDTLVREIMLPRIYITALEVNTPLEQALDLFLQSGHSRVPVYQDSVDNILGLLYAKDLLKVWREGGHIETLRSLLRTAYFVPEAKAVDELLAEMQTRRVHMAIVVDEYGGVAGLVTMEDIVEEIVGEIRDEYDQSEEMPYTRINEGEYLFQGQVDLGDFNELMESHLPMDESETLGGFIYGQVGRVPLTGETVLVDDLELTVEQVSKRRIRKVRARKLPREADGGQHEAHDAKE
jgi:CBS domain containing-hemolysin-like protein